MSPLVKKENIVMNVYTPNNQNSNIFACWITKFQSLPF